jgi:hypothetical protein
MDRYDEAKHVSSIDSTDDVRPLHPGDERAMRPDDLPLTRPEEEEVVAADRDIRVSPAGGLSPDTDIDIAPDADMPRDPDLPKREGDILGLGGAVVPKTADDQTTAYDAESVAQRHARRIETDEAGRESDMPRSKGATGIDLGSGGSGTDIE